MTISQWRRLLNGLSRGLGAVSAAKRGRTGAWAARQVVYKVGGRVLGRLTRRVR